MSRSPGGGAVAAVVVFDVPALIWKLGRKLTPPSMLIAAKNCASSFGVPSLSPAPPAPRSFRASCQETAMYPVVGSTAMRGRNWLLVRTSLTRTGVLQCRPSSSENRRKMSVSLVSIGAAGGRFVWTSSV